MIPIPTSDPIAPMEEPLTPTQAQIHPYSSLMEASFWVFVHSKGTCVVHIFKHTSLAQTRG